MLLLLLCFIHYNLVNFTLFFTLLRWATFLLLIYFSAIQYVLRNVVVYSKRAVSFLHFDHEQCPIHK